MGARPPSSREIPNLTDDDLDSLPRERRNPSIANKSQIDAVHLRYPLITLP